MKTNMLLRSTSYLIIAAVALVSSCKDDEQISSKDTQNISEEAETDTYFQDMDDMAGVAINADAATYTGGRVASDGRTSTTRTITVEDDRFKCSGIVVTIEVYANSTASIPQGKITVNFGTTGCTDLRGNVRTGKLFFVYYGKRFMPNSTVTTTGENYTINGIKLAGTRVLTNVSTSTGDAPKFNVVLTGGVATFQDGSTATRESNITSQWIRATNPLEDKLIIDQTSVASGTTRTGSTYQVSLLKQLEFKRSCGIAVSGIKKYVVDGTKEITIDYGDGTCDKSITITVNGITRSITVK